MGRRRLMFRKFAVPEPTPEPVPEPTPEPTPEPVPEKKRGFSRKK